MGGFGNYLGATMGTSKDEEGHNGSVYDNSYVTNSNFPQRQELVGPDGDFVHVNTGHAATDGSAYRVDSNLLGDVPGLLGDDTAYQAVQTQLHGPQALNWESKNFVDLRHEMEALSPDQMTTQASAWRDHGNTLKTTSEEFKKSAGDAIAGHWSGESATAAEAASKHVTKTSIYDFTASSDALANRLTALSGAFSHIRTEFPTDADDSLIDRGVFNQARLEQRVNEFNSRYHLDGGGRLRNNDDGYVTAADALNELHQIKLSIADYQRAVQLFRDTYNPTVEAVTQDFPMLPPPPNMQFEQPTTGPGGGQPHGGGGGGGSGVGGGGGGGGGGTPAIPSSQLGKGAGINPAVAQQQWQGAAIDPSQWTSAIDGLDPGGNQPDPGPGTGIDPTMPGTSTDPTISPLDDGGMSPFASGLANQASNGASQALNSAMGAAKPGAGGVPGGLGRNPALPEGALRLGKGDGAHPGAGMKGSGGGAGIGGAKDAASRLPGLAAAATHGEAAGGPAAARSATGAMGATAGSPGSPGPAGHGGGAGQGKDHKPNKALRSKRNGEEFLEEGESVIAVLGETAQEATARLGRPSASGGRGRE